MIQYGRNLWPSIHMKTAVVNMAVLRLTTVNHTHLVLMPAHDHRHFHVDEFFAGSVHFGNILNKLVFIRMTIILVIRSGLIDCARAHPFEETEY